MKVKTTFLMMCLPVSSWGGFFMYSYIKTGFFFLSLSGCFYQTNEHKEERKVKLLQKCNAWQTYTRGWGGGCGEGIVNDFISQIAPHPTIFPTDDRRWKPQPERGLGESVLPPLLHADCHFNDDFWIWTLGFAQITLFFPKKTKTKKKTHFWLLTFPK